MKKNNESTKDESTNNNEQESVRPPESTESTEPANNASAAAGNTTEGLEPPKSESEAEDDGLPKLILEEHVTGTSVALSPQRAAALSKWVITQSTGIYSADSQDDQPKSAFLMIVKALAYERDHSIRETFFMEIEKTVFHYTMAADNARERFIQRGLANLDAMVKRGQMTD